MIWPLPTFFRPGFFALFLAVQLAAGTVTGHVRLTDSMVKKHVNFSNVVVWLENPGPYAPLTKHVRMLQKDKTFTPHVLAISAGTFVDFPNADPIFHSAFSNFNGQIFDIGLYPPGSTRSVRFSRPGIVRVFCNIHPAMSAVIVVVNSSLFDKTGEDGSFTLTNVPAGDYELHFFHERATSETLDKLTRRVVVNGGTIDLGVIDISETGYLPIPHKNKYGRDYPDHQQDYSIPVK